jgi:3-oxoacyl-[acyl-carrier-protein] synthase-3
MGRQPNDSYAGLVAIAHTTPPDIQTANALAPLVNRDAAWIIENAGVERRHVCKRYDDPAVLIRSIAKPIIQQHGEPDLLINASAMPRQLLPDGSVFIARELGLVGTPAFSINATCLSFLVAMNTARSLILSGNHDSVMICCCEFPSLSRNFDQPESAALFGDAAAVAVLKRDQGAAFGNFSMETYPEAAELAQLRGGGVLRMPDDANTTPKDHVFDMQGEALLRFTLPRLKRFVRRHLESAELSIDDIDLVVPHQASRSGVQIVEKLGFPKSKTVDILADYGNCVSASIPMALSIAVQSGRVHPGHRVLLLGTAAGMSIGAGVLQW